MSDPPPDPTECVWPPGATTANVGAAIRRHLRETNRDWLRDKDITAIAKRIAADPDRPRDADGSPHEAEVEAVASFFPHFRREKPRRVELRVCRDLSCWLRGATGLARQLREDFAGVKRVRIEEVSCLGRCDRAPAACGSRFVRAGAAPAGWAEVCDHLYLGRTRENLRDTVRALLRGWVPQYDTDRVRLAPPWWRLTQGAGGFTQAGHFLDAMLGSPDRDATRLELGAALIDTLAKADLRGRGGPGEVAHRKWRDVLDAKTRRTKYVVANGDESEPGTFKDRDLLLAAPKLVVEGVILAGLAVGAGRGYIYIRHEYGEQIAAVRAAIAAAEDARVCGTNIRGTGFDFPVRVFVSPGGYICGEQTALIEAMEGKRAQPRNRPPELGANGLFDQPTLLTNVETLAWAAAVAHRGEDWQRATEAEEAPRGWRLFSVSGDVNAPGVYELAVGRTLGELIAAAGGVAGELVAVGTSGPSGGFLPPVLPAQLGGGSVLDLRLDGDEFRRLKEGVERAAFAGRLGSDAGVVGVPLLGAGIIVYATRSFADRPPAEGAPRTILDAARNASEFFARESCGKCVPCRLGTQKLIKLRNADEVRELAAVMGGASICGLGQVAANPLATALTFPT